MIHKMIPLGGGEGIMGGCAVTVSERLGTQVPSYDHEKPSEEGWGSGECGRVDQHGYTYTY